MLITRVKSTGYVSPDTINMCFKIYILDIGRMALLDTGGNLVYD